MAYFRGYVSLRDGNLVTIQKKELWGREVLFQNKLPNLMLPCPPKLAESSEPRCIQPS